ncbi:hypothetical protein ABZV64_27080 [Streptomyces sp. NPDC004959]|uniref:hypothetical protein n=1 Tax=unclassified Streptomyces TaxID=2593676 RepID=UPI000B0C6B91|nr:hypothetical protein [Streptomyces sp. NRRL F-5630]
MSAVVPALALGVLTASGCVWYVPALVDLRAGADRPVSRRLAALACLSGWGTAGLAAVLLLTGAPLAVAGAGVLACAALRLAAWGRARGEAREHAAYWAALDAHPDARRAPHRVVGAVIATGLTAATGAGVALIWAHARGAIGVTPLVAAPSALTACTLAAALLTASRRGSGERTGAAKTDRPARTAPTAPGRTAAPR